MKPKGQILLPEGGIWSCSYLYWTPQNDMDTSIHSFLIVFLAHSAFPPEYVVNPEYLEREPPKVYPGCSGVYPYHPFPMGFAINQSSCRGAPSPSGISLQRGLRHIPSNYGPGNAAPVAVSSGLLITSANVAVFPFSCLLAVKVPVKSYAAYQLHHSILIYCAKENISKWWC